MSLHRKYAAILKKTKMFCSFFGQKTPKVVTMTDGTFVFSPKIERDIFRKPMHIFVGDIFEEHACKVTGIYILNGLGGVWI